MNCLNQFQQFLVSVGSWACKFTANKGQGLTCSTAGAVVDFIAILLVLLSPFFMYRNREKISRMLRRCCLKTKNEEPDNIMSFSRGGGDLKSPILREGYIGDGPDEGGDRKSIDSDGQSLSRPRLASWKSTMNRYSFPDKMSEANNFRKLRNALRLGDGDIVNHACRIFLLGSNHPLRSRGIDDFIMMIIV